MSYWRPSPQNIYAIGDLHGKFKSLNSILKRILPLKDKDQIVFLGDYIDRGPSSAKIIEKFCDLKEKYGSQITWLLGNHELMFMEVLELVTTNMLQEPVDNVWIHNGGVATIRSYAYFNKLKDDSIPLFRLKTLVPDRHKEFLMSLVSSYETDKYIFAHAGYDVFSKENNKLKLLLWDKSLYGFVIKSIIEGNKLPWDKTIITGHNWKGPIIYDKYMMLDTSHKTDVLCVELNSMEGFWASELKTRLVKADIKETTKLDIFREVDLSWQV